MKYARISFSNLAAFCIGTWIYALYVNQSEMYAFAAGSTFFFGYIMFFGQTE